MLWGQNKTSQKLTDKIILNPLLNVFIYIYIYIDFNTVIQLPIYGTLYIYTPSEYDRNEP